MRQAARAGKRNTGAHSCGTQKLSPVNAAGHHGDCVTNSHVRVEFLRGKISPRIRGLLTRGIKNGGYQSGDSGFAGGTGAGDVQGGALGFLNKFAQGMGVFCNGLVSV